MKVELPSLPRPTALLFVFLLAPLHPLVAEECRSVPKGRPLSMQGSIHAGGFRNAAPSLFVGVIENDVYYVQRAISKCPTPKSSIVFDFSAAKVVHSSWGFTYADVVIQCRECVPTQFCCHHKGDELGLDALLKGVDAGLEHCPKPPVQPATAAGSPISKRADYRSSEIGKYLRTFPARFIPVHETNCRWAITKKRRCVDRTSVDIEKKSGGWEIVVDNDNEAISGVIDSIRVDGPTTKIHLGRSHGTGSPGGVVTITRAEMPGHYLIEAEILQGQRFIDERRKDSVEEIIIDDRGEEGPCD